MGIVNDRVDRWSEKIAFALRRDRPWSIGRDWLTAAFVTAEASLIVAVAVVTGVGYHEFAYGEAGDIANYFTVGSLLALMYLLPLLSSGELRAQAFLEGKRSHGRIFVVWNIAFLCLAFVGLMTKTTGIFSRAWLVAFYATGLLSLMALESGITRALAAASSSGRLALRRLMIVGTAADIARATRAMEPSSGGVRVVATAVMPDEYETAEAVAAMRVALEKAAGSARRLHVDDVMIVSDWTRDSVIREVVGTFGKLPMTVHLGVSDLLSRVSDARITSFGGTRALSLTAPPLSSAQAAVKRILDIAVSATALALLSPVFLVIGVMIAREGNGPVFFRQRRRGYNLEEFRIWKFRTMTTLDDGDVVRQASRGDTRVTGIGAVLRRYNLDELPQLINVLTGDMSLVGPRPHAVAHDQFFETRIDQYQRRLNVKPGITGWAQVNGHRGPTETDDAMRARVEHDLYYIDNWSIWFDIYILIATVFARKAYRNAF
ncbi:MAG: exopolysaccharide biosynthesis polyprenyl glycosylphosphotransferase [Hyphomicrobiaceae bacterium]|nr:exopolysaccharide biosynthesis polyprenyl glycosylphosphotransferase [Hyphomicrobiaceae bacterium]